MTSTDKIHIHSIRNINHPTFFLKQTPHQLLNGKYSFPDDNFMLWRKKKKTNFTVSSRKEIIREMKVDKYNSRFPNLQRYNF